MVYINNQVIEEILSYFGRTGSNQRPRIRKFHAELFLTKYFNKERIISMNEINRPKEYLDRMVKYSKGYLEYINEEAGEIKITDAFYLRIEAWLKQYLEVEELDESDENLLEQGIIITDDGITFDGKLTYSRFYKVISDEGESMNNPKDWIFNAENIKSYDYIDFSKKNSPIFGSRLSLLKFYVLRKIDEVAFVTSRFVHCPVCGSNYVVQSSKIDFQQSYKCEKFVGDKQCKTVLKKFPARKMIPTYIYEVGIEVKGSHGIEFKEFFLESFNELVPGFYTGMIFGRTENKSNSFYFTCLTAKTEKSRHPFELIKKEQHNFFNLIDSVVNHIEKIGFVIDKEKARLPIIIETLKKLIVTVNKEINMDHSLYFGAPGIGKTYALTLLHHLFYSNSGFISGPRFTIAGLTGGQKEIYYQDTTKKKNVPGLFSNQAFVFDEINNAQFLSDDKATNLFKSVVLASSGTSSTVGGKEFRRIALIAATANYDLDHLRHYENKVKKVYESEVKLGEQNKVQEQSLFLANLNKPKEANIPDGFDYYAPLKKYGLETPKELKTAILRIRDDGKNYLTGFAKPLMERFYYSVLVHPKYDKMYERGKSINVDGYLETRKLQFSNRELISQLYVPEFDDMIKKEIEITEKNFEKFESIWSEQAKEFLDLLSNKYIEFFSMFNRINEVHVFALYSLSMFNKETSLSFETKRLFERIISLLHNPIDIKDFHFPNFEDFEYIGETKRSIFEIIKKHENIDLRKYIDYTRDKVRKTLTDLENDKKIIKIKDYHYKIDTTNKFEEVDENENRKTRNKMA